jgi:hypothetical protein
VHLAHEPDRLADVLEQVLEHDGVEARVREGQGLVHVAVHDPASAGGRGGHRLAGAVDAGVVGEVLGQPGRAAAHVQQPGAGLEVPRDVAEVAGLLVPVEVAHGRAGR